MVDSLRKIPCDCGSGIEREKCCYLTNKGQIVHFSLGKKNNYKVQINKALEDLTSYAFKYFYSWESAAKAKFFAYSQTEGLNENFMPFFRTWFAINYRFYKDVSPIIDFYIAENDEIIDDNYRPILTAIKNSHISIFEVEWIENNTVALKDIFNNISYIVERDFGNATGDIKEGRLLLTRIVQIGNTAIVAQTPYVIFSDQKRYLIDEINSIKSLEGIEDIDLFCREFSQVICSLIIDVSCGNKKPSIKMKTILLNDNLEKIRDKISSRKDFAFIEKSNNFLKFTLTSNKKFLRFYVNSSLAVIAAEETTELTKGKLSLESALNLPHYKWYDGYTAISDDYAEELLTEIMHDKYLEEWLETQQEELEGMTPLQAIRDVKGRVLLENLLNDMDLSVKSNEESIFPIEILRTKIGLLNSRTKKMLDSEAVTLKVQKHRERQELSFYPNSYNWLSNDYNQVAISLYDYYTQHEKDEVRLAWLLFIWNEYSTIYRPKVSKIKAWVSSIECCLSYCIEDKKESGTLKKLLGVPGIINKNIYLLIKHFTEHPIDISIQPKVYPNWDELDYRKMIEAYEEVKQYLSIFSYAIKPRWPKTDEDIRNEFYEGINTEATFWDEGKEKKYKDFYLDNRVLDNRSDRGETIANFFWETQAKRFQPYLRSAAFNLMTSYVGAYRVLPAGSSSVIFEDIFTGKQSEVYGRFNKDVHDDIDPGMIVLTRVLPLGKYVWASEPMFILLNDLTDIFYKYLDMLLENLHLFDEGDYIYLKQRGECALKAYLMALDEVEKDTVDLMNQPIQIDWFVADINDSQFAIDRIGHNKQFELVHQDEDRTAYIWMCNNSTQMSQWGYLLVKDNKILICAPPGKDLIRFSKEVYRSFKTVDIVVAFRKYETIYKTSKELERYFISDLATFFNNQPELSLALLRQDELEDEELELLQGIFLLKLGTLLMEEVEQNKKK
ncbi:hypothetical protein SYNTR_1472 [Candidatus Syntrophocurvum alkaliphilum]|uniref:Antitoxin Xre/MbcA/ParS-like toxin-binding domain-containing protein n=1 Tax=Candidatus Syntrophocurvum alkaliphilum TaxID=2293317 RepID=A0A6I6DBR2_9FIRM|nr:hypothetical protein [Candidatus Syntrophocurvum alkaliphilum]QGU00066.1 hypothetical protein SYNTR_1472 [Candidatus Syntrophocurvum alkaliphilum]